MEQVLFVFAIASADLNVTANNIANVNTTGFKSSRAEFADLLSGRTPSDLVSMCGSGVTAAHNLLAMAHAGLVGAKLYTGSWSGWISDDDRPVATGNRC